MTTQCFSFDFTLDASKANHQDIIALYPEYIKKYTFQLEEGDEGYQHFQGRFSLVKKRRLGEAIKLIQPFLPTIHLTPTTNNGLDQNFYVMKADTRIEGPWKDTDKITYIPRQYRDLMDNLYPYQEFIKQDACIFNKRTINLIFDETGNNGKSTIAALMELFGNGIDVPPCNEFKELIQVMCDICMGGNLRAPTPVFIDMPRAMNKERLYGLYSAIEQIKKGKLFDFRYKYKAWWIDSPNIWVFSNNLPDRALLSNDRWKVWTIDNNKMLVPYDYDISLF